MTKRHLISRQPKRLFAFGCSFTNYFWTTWPEIIALDLGLEYYNLAKGGAGNLMIMNRIMQADNVYGFNEDDLVMVCWSSVEREDRYNEKWHFHTAFIADDDKEYWIKYYSNLFNPSLRDFAFIKATAALLENTKCQWHYMSLNNLGNSVGTHYLRKHSFRESPNDMKMLRDQYQNTLNLLLPDFLSTLWQGDWKNKLKLNYQILKIPFDDSHPSPDETLEYLRLVFDHPWKSITIDAISDCQLNWKAEIIKSQKLENCGFKRLANPIEHSLF